MSLATKNNPHIVLCFAMYDEAKALIQKTGVIENTQLFHSKLPQRIFQGKYKDFSLSIVTSGTDTRYDNVDNIGCEAAVLSAYESIRILTPDLVISAGTAGGFSKRGAVIGKVYLSHQSIFFHDRHVPLPGFQESAIGAYPCVDAIELAKQLNLDVGTISSGSSLQKSSSDIDLIEKYGAIAKEMEAAAIAWVSMLFNTPFLAVKSITNIVDENNKSEEAFLGNFDLACVSLTNTIIQLLNKLDQNTLKKWKLAC